MSPESHLKAPVWRSKSACRGLPISWFFDPVEAVLEGSPDAVLICNGCEVRTECLEYALDREILNALHGIWGGKTPKERAEIIRLRRKR